LHSRRDECRVIIATAPRAAAAL